MIYKYLVIEDNPKAVETLRLLMADFASFRKRSLPVI